tara:strand:- start:4794 stop:5378 length:585 start_codon:yes stop_codon:yes gene_type:complete
MNDKRTPAGQPTGGEFAAHHRADSDVTLTTVAEPAGDPWVIMENGLPRNAPRYPVFDIDELQEMTELDELVSFRDRAYNIGLIHYAQEADGILDDCFGEGNYPEMAEIDFDKYERERYDPQRYYLLEGGVVQNSPADEVFDLNFLAGYQAADVEEIKSLEDRVRETRVLSEAQGRPAPELQEIERRCAAYRQSN